MASELKGSQVGGPGKIVETDGGYFGGYVKPANYRENRRAPFACGGVTLRFIGESSSVMMLMERPQDSPIRFGVLAQVIGP
jgi:hypothetical protein